MRLANRIDVAVTAISRSIYQFHSTFGKSSLSRYETVAVKAVAAMIHVL